jgi:butyrate kinase
MGGGISIGAHAKGKVVDVNQALDGDGPFSPERSGTLPMNQVIKACFSGEYTYEEMKKMVTGKGGYVAYFGHSDALAIENAAKDGDEKAILIQNAMAYQIAKEIGSAAVVLKGKIDAILLTGGLAYGKPLVNEIESYIQWIAPVYKYPGEDEMSALAMNALMILTKEITANQYR